MSLKLAIKTIYKRRAHVRCLLQNVVDVLADHDAQAGQSLESQADDISPQAITTQMICPIATSTKQTGKPISRPRPGPLAPALRIDTPQTIPPTPATTDLDRQFAYSVNEATQTHAVNSGQQMGVGGDIPQVSVQNAAGIPAGATTCPTTPQTKLVLSASPGPGVTSVSS